ncbi:isocitrate lyase/PEP mutase family protein [Streptomyces sp. WMMC1477]|uniref:isocitrate lyase/PEP mutase family protein n=1 Tax=Streptomyces sp. WMMC1477 TaxID=3015155 RepID=UPI0022B70140|nr:isocitrate lyase/phosphoenolpyruvate mutase family protein [Streptomyces sp. WMMC1477]MCZ7434156.1 isocitrate lyase/phosphoenolpyruvate mutase family protein [Streptomyces sp. WMMC1477]
MPLHPSQRDRACTLRTLVDDGPLLLPNAWDAASAAVIADAGAAAVATTSGGVAWSLGRGDGHGLTREEMAEAVRRVVAAVDVPVTADVEGGYGPAPEDVAATVSAVIAAGAVGVNVEDSRGPGELFTAREQGERIRAARARAERDGLPELLVNIRTDVYLFRVGVAEERLADVLARAEVYAEAGADGLFVPELLDLDALAALTERSPLPVNALAVPGGPGVKELAAVGVRRISLGTGVAQAAYAVAREATRELLDTGTYSALAGGLDYGTLDGLVSG